MLVYVNVALAILEDVPMSVLSLLWMLRSGQEADLTLLISIMMGSGMVCVYASLALVLVGVNIGVSNLMQM